MRWYLPLAGLCLAIVFGAPALAANAEPLAPGPNVEIVGAICNSCHTSDYIIMNSTFLSAATWKAEVVKMRSVFGAPMDDDMQAMIVDYLAATYAVAPPKN